MHTRRLGFLGMERVVMGDEKLALFQASYSEQVYGIGAVGGPLPEIG